MRKRLTVDKDGQLVDREGTVVGKLVSMTLDVGVGVRGGIADSSTTATEISANAQETLLPDGGAGEDPTSDVSKVWAHYQQVVPNGKSYKLDAKRRSMISNALKVRSMETVLRAIEGLAASPHHNGQNDRRTKYLTIQYALQGKRGESNDERIDKMAEKAPTKRAPGQTDGRSSVLSMPQFLEHASPIARAEVWNHVRNVVKWRQNPSHTTLETIGRESSQALAVTWKIRVVTSKTHALVGVERIEEAG